MYVTGVSKVWKVSPSFDQTAMYVIEVSLKIDMSLKTCMIQIVPGGRDFIFNFCIGKDHKGDARMADCMNMIFITLRFYNYRSASVDAVCYCGFVISGCCLLLYKSTHKYKWMMGDLS